MPPVAVVSPVATDRQTSYVPVTTVSPIAALQAAVPVATAPTQLPTVQEGSGADYVAMDVSVPPAVLPGKMISRHSTASTGSALSTSRLLGRPVSTVSQGEVRLGFDPQHSVHSRTSQDDTTPRDSDLALPNQPSNEPY